MTHLERLDWSSCIEILLQLIALFRGKEKMEQLPC